MISNDRLEKALTYLSQTDEQSAKLKADVARREYACDLTRRRVFLLATGGVEERKAFAEVHEDVQRAESNELMPFSPTRRSRRAGPLRRSWWMFGEASRRRAARGQFNERST